MLRINLLDSVRARFWWQVRSGDWRAVYRPDLPLILRIAATLTAILVFLVVYFFWMILDIVVYPMIGLFWVGRFLMGRKMKPTCWYRLTIPVSPQEYAALRLSLLDLGTPEIREYVRFQVSGISETLCFATERTAHWAMSLLAEANIPCRAHFIGFSRPKRGLILKPTEYNGPISTLISALWTRETTEEGIIPARFVD
jgi:hypothetical protein